MHAQMCFNFRPFADRRPISENREKKIESSSTKCMEDCSPNRLETDMLRDARDKRAAQKPDSSGSSKKSASRHKVKKEKGGMKRHVREELQRWNEWDRNMVTTK